MPAEGFTRYSMDGWMISFTLTPRYASDMQATTSICILVALIIVIITFLTGEIYASPRGLCLAFVLDCVVVVPLAHGYKTFETLPRSPGRLLSYFSYFNLEATNKEGLKSYENVWKSARISFRRKVH
jgi:hypothetical protein